MCGIQKTPADAISFFLQKRGQGITYPSQKRYVRYFNRVLCGYSVPTHYVRLVKVIMHGVPNIDGKKGCEPFINVYKENSKLLFSTKKEMKFCMHREKMAVFYVKMDVSGDIVLQFCTGFKSKEMFRIAFHTGFITCGEPLVFKKNDLDEFHKKEEINPNFSVELLFEESPVVVDDEKETYMWETAYRDYAEHMLKGVERYSYEDKGGTLNFCATTNSIRVGALAKPQSIGTSSQAVPADDVPPPSAEEDE